MDPHSPNKLFATKYCFLMLGDNTSFFFFISLFFVSFFAILLNVIINFYKNVPGCSGMFRNKIIIILFIFFIKITLIFSCSGMFRNVPACSGMFGNVRECSRMFRVAAFIDCLTINTYTHALKHKVTIAWEHCQHNFVQSLHNGAQ